MPAKDTFHEDVRMALISEGWKITHDPYTLSFGNTKVYTDLGAERPIAAERGDERIAVEIKSFVTDSPVRELELSIGQYILYGHLMARVDPQRQLYIAVPHPVYKSFFELPATQRVIDELAMKLVVFDAERKERLQWFK